MWEGASRACQLYGGARIFSGPFPTPGHTVSEVCESPRHHVNRKTGSVSITVHPHIFGGGVKTENEGWVQSRLAALCLQQGLNLQRATEFADALVPRVGAKALLQVLSKPPSTTVWTEVKVIAQTAKVEVPEGADLQVAAEVRLRKAAAKQKLRSPPEIVAADVSVSCQVSSRTKMIPMRRCWSSCVPGCQGCSWLILTERGAFCAPSLPLLRMNWPSWYSGTAVLARLPVMAW